MQDMFSAATGVASIITHPNGVPITRPSNFCRLCIDIIRKTEKGLKNCYHSDAVIGTFNPNGATYQPCLSGGLWDAGASISVGGKHVANWLIGQVKNDKTDEKKMLAYANDIGADEDEFKKAMDEVPVMPIERFNKIADFLYIFANEISNRAYQDIQQKRLIAQLQEKEQQLTEAKEKAEESRLRLHTLINTLPDLVWLKDIDGVYLECNRRFEDFFGAGRDEIIGKSDFDFVDAETATFFRDNDKAAVEAGKPTINEEQIAFANDGHQEYLETIKTPVYSSEHRPAGVLGIGRNITQRVIGEQELIKAKERAEESDRLKTAFLQNLSHEIRTPMNAIVGFSDFIDDPELSPEKRKSFTAIIKSSAYQLLSIITDILSISSIETKQEKANVENVCVNDVIVELLAIFKPQAFNHNISLFAKKQLVDEFSEIYTDKTKLTQILTNLISNAMKFTHEGTIEFGYSLKDDLLEFYVQDSGIGIAADLQEKIFDRFRQADDSINKKYGGTGLGLAISKAYAEILGGSIWVQSQQDKGATFFFTIPYRPVHENAATTLPSTSKDNKKVVLVAEDEEYNYLYLEELLSRTDIEVIHAKNGQETVDACKSNQDICLVFMDIKMPVMDGYVAAKIIKEFRPELTIIAQSAYAMEHEREKFSGNAFDEYITKPINKVVIQQLMVKYLGSNC